VTAGAASVSVKADSFASWTPEGAFGDLMVSRLSRLWPY
jgi:hypothetical protein